MPKYTVTFHATGTASITVEADDEDSAIEKAAEEIGVENLNDWDIDKASAEVQEEKE